jgi:L-2,4-diaminobutyrate decarboxylase
MSFVSDETADDGQAFVDLIAGFLADAGSRDVAAPGTRDHAALDALLAEPPPAEGRPLADVLDRVRRDVLPNTAWVRDPGHMAHQLAPPLGVSIWSESLVGAINQSMAVAELSPISTALERRVIRWLADLAGFPEEAGGTFAVGATEATFTSLAAARSAAMPDAFRDGVSGDAVIICGEHSHYSVSRAAGLLGLGTRRCLKVPSDAAFHLDPSALARMLGEHRAIAVVATAGTTNVGGFDDLGAIAQVCRDHGVWLHVDGAHGASALVSERHRHRMAGIDGATSLAWDPHKMLLMSVPASALVIRDEALLDGAFAQRAEYLFHGAGARVRDQGVRSFQCTRRSDALKVWIAWQRHGTAGLAATYDHLCETTTGIHALIEDDPRYDALHVPESNILCFRHRGGDAVNEQLRPVYNAGGQGFISQTRLGDRPCLRVTIMNPRTTLDDAAAMLDELDRLAGAIERGA